VENTMSGEIIIPATPVTVKCVLDEEFIIQKRPHATHYEYQFCQPYSCRDLSLPVIKYEKPKLPEKAVCTIFREPRKYYSVRRERLCPGLERDIIKLQKPITPIVAPKYVLALIAVEGKSTWKSGKWINNDFLTPEEPLYSVTSKNTSRFGSHWLDIAIIVAPKVIIKSEGNTPWAKGTIVLTPP